jgi:predicted PurR-regulated permease PerM
MDISDQKFQDNMMTSYIQIAAVTIIVFWCFTIISPFIGMVLWALIIAVALYPLHQSLTAKMGNRAKLSATIFVLLGLTILVLPTILLAESSIEGIRAIATGMEDGTIVVPPPNQSVADWPLIGSSVYDIWSAAARNLEETLNKFAPQLQDMGKSLLAFAGSSAVGVLVFVFSIIVAGVFLVSADGGYRVASGLGRTLSNEHGKDMIDMAIETIRSVAKGVLGVAVIQALLSAIGLVAIGVPGAGLWAGLILLLAIMQLPPLIVLGPIAVWVFSVSNATPATIFAIYAFFVSISDSFLKPLFLGRGMDIPMLVILIGAIGGMMTSGIVGLFVGAVVLAVGYKLLVSWMISEEAEELASQTESNA